MRNLIASWAINAYDYLFSVDSDLAFPPDTLEKLLSHDKDIVSGLYIQRLPGQNLELYGKTGRIKIEELTGPLMEIESCGFGCVLVKSEVLKKVGYPQFVYHSALDHSHTLSEDTDFCIKAKKAGFSIWADSTIRCDHKGNTWFKLEMPDIIQTKQDPIQKRLQELGEQRLLPQSHLQYLIDMKNAGTEPKVIYDIGACVLHWSNEAYNHVWKNSDYYCFEAMDETAFLYNKPWIKGFHNGLLTDEHGNSYEFYQNLEHPGGNSYYKENVEVNPDADAYFNDSHKVIKTGHSLDVIVREKGFKLPDLIKMDVQGAELDVLRGADICVAHATDIILELQHTEYNKGAPNRAEVIEYLNQKGFSMINHFTRTANDGDYHFRRIA